MSIVLVTLMPVIAAKIIPRVVGTAGTMQRYRMRKESKIIEKITQRKRVLSAFP
jgi:hypothetical protein